MFSPYRFRCGPLALSLALLTVSLSCPAIAVNHTQNLQLVAGWNSVWLAVEPRDADGSPAPIATVFATTPEVVTVATLFKPIGTAEYFTAGVATRFNEPAWGVWRRHSTLQEDTLVTMPGQRGYLIQASAATTVAIAGAVWFQTPNWQPDSFNLVGFNLLGAVTFDQLFANAGGRHPLNRIFALQADGNWTGVQGSDVMVDGAAYMIYADGRSDFMGAVSVRAGRSLDFGAGPGTTTVPAPGGSGDIDVTTRELTFSNPTDTVQTPRLRKVPSTDPNAPPDADLQLFHIVPDTVALASTIDIDFRQQEVDDMPFPVNLGTSRTVTLGVFRNWDTQPVEREELYRIELGTHYFWLPVTAENETLSAAADGTPDADYAGLWIGDAVVNTVSSITEAGAPQSPTTSNVPLRILIHVDSSGTAWLLSHVLLMQEKSADDAEVPPGIVLVVDEAKIPFFDGIEERRGKRVGQRFESVAYDMPRKIDIATQAELIPEVAIAMSKVEGAVTADDIGLYVNARTSRPPKLLESYHLKWELTGGFGPDAIVRTPTDSPLLLDPFHRSNPFRHAFHPQHGAGIDIARAIKLTFDPVQAAGQLQGDYEETLAGLTNDDDGLVVRGRIALQRLIAVGVVQ